MTHSMPRILVVDDDPDIRANLTDILSDMGYRVDSAADGHNALEMAQHNPYDAALVDLRMPGMDGLELCRRLKTLCESTVAIIVSAFVTGEVAETAIREGAWRTLPKPLDFSRLQVLLAEAVEQPLVIIVDDDPELCMSLWDLLREREYRVCIAHSFEQAKQRLTNRNFQLALIDMKLPDADGVKVLRLVRETNPQARVVVITGWRTQMQERIEQAMAEGADAVCYKPFDVQSLVATMKQLSSRVKQSDRNAADSPH